MPGIFISYRRDDSRDAAGRLYDALAREFGEERVFMDVDAIRPGDDFVERVEDTVREADTFLPVIGGRWLSATDARGRRRLETTGDFVRLEIGRALRRWKERRDIRVIPVLLEDAVMPGPEDLPPELGDLWRLQAFRLSYESWGSDIQRLLVELRAVADEQLERRKAEQAKREAEERERREAENQTRRHPDRRARGEMEKRKRRGGNYTLLAVIVAVTVLLAAGLISTRKAKGPTSPTSSPATPYSRLLQLIPAPVRAECHRVTTEVGEIAAAKCYGNTSFGATKDFALFSSVAAAHARYGFLLVNSRLCRGPEAIRIVRTYKRGRASCRHGAHGDDPEITWTDDQTKMAAQLSHPKPGITGTELAREWKRVYVSS